MTVAPSHLLGLNQPFPTRAWEELARQWGVIDKKAFRFLRKNLPNALAVQSPAALDDMLNNLKKELPTYLPHATAVEQATKSGELLNVRHRTLFFKSLSQATGIVLLNTDNPHSTGPDLTLSSTGNVQVEVSGPIAAMPPGSRGDAMFNIQTTGANVAVVKANPDPKLSIDTFVDQSTSRITTLQTGVVEGVRDAVIREATIGGSDPEELTRQLLDQWEEHGVPSQIETRRLTLAGNRVLVTARAHAAFIARDQLGTLNMELTRARQTAAGIEAFTWITMGDSRVRDEHRERNGKQYTWGDGADGEFPGGPPGCRCHARAVIDPGKVHQSPELQFIG